MFALEGSLVSVEPVEDAGSELLWRCTLTLAGFSHRVVAYVAERPEGLPARSSARAWRRTASSELCAGSPPSRSPCLAPHLQWRPQSPLGNLGMDFGVFAGVRDSSELMAADHAVFYRMLLLARNADPVRLNRDAARLDASSQGLPALFHDPAGQRGRLVKLAGTARRVVRVPIDDPPVVSRLGADHYFEIDLMAEGSQGNPLGSARWNCPVACRWAGHPSMASKSK